MERNKEAIIASGIDPDLKRLRHLHAIRAGYAKKLKAAQDALAAAETAVEYYWYQVEEALTAEVT